MGAKEDWGRWAGAAVEVVGRTRGAIADGGVVDGWTVEEEGDWEGGVEEVRRVVGRARGAVATPDLADKRSGKREEDC